MPIRVTCSSCSKTYRLKDELAGRKIRCPQCKAPLTVPSSAEEAGPKPPPRRAPSARQPAPPPKKRAKRTSTVKIDYAAQTAISSTPTEVMQNRPGNTEHKTVCPSCGRAVPTRASTCPSCKYNLKLGRKLSISAAIEDAGREPGTRADGTQFVTRAQMAEERAEKGRKIGILIKVALGMTLLIIPAIFFYAKSITYWGPPLEEMRKSRFIKPPRRLGALHPYNTGLDVSIDIPRTEIWVEKVSFKGGAKSAVELGTAFAQNAKLPFFRSDPPVLEYQTRRIMAKISDLGGTYSPESLSKGINGDMLVWRKQGDIGKKGFLAGAIIDAGKSRNAFIETLNSKARGDSIHISGVMSFVASRHKDLGNGSYTYPTSVKKGLDWIPLPPEGETAGKNLEDEEKRDIYYFHPVIIVKTFALETNRSNR